MLTSAMDLHREALVIDGHTDVPTRLWEEPADLSQRLTDRHIDLPRLREGGVDALVFAIEARRSDPAAALELRLVVADGDAVRKGSWQEAAQRLQEVRIEWRSTTPGGNNGTLALSLGGRSALWLDGLTSFTGRPATLLILHPERKSEADQQP